VNPMRVRNERLRWTSGGVGVEAVDQPSGGLCPWPAPLGWAVLGAAGHQGCNGGRIRCHRSATQGSRAVPAVVPSGAATSWPRRLLALKLVVLLYRVKLCHHAGSGRYGAAGRPVASVSTR